ncbi:unnamed protein product [Rhodiola kirilowii]
MAMGMAHVAEQKIHAGRWVSGRPPGSRYSPRPSSQAALGTSPTKALPSKGNLPIKQLTPAEMAVRREKGLCYNCDERYSPSHIFKPRFQCLVLEEMGSDDEEAPLVIGDETGPVQEVVPSISFHAMQGRPVPRTLRLEGALAGRQVIILIDSGSTHNFIQSRVAKNAGLAVEETKHLSVTVGNGDELRCEGFCRGVNLDMGGKPFTIDFHLLPIYGADLVLGAQWLSEVGPVTFDYKELWMSIEYENEPLRLQGMVSNAQFSALTLGQLKRVKQTKAVMTMFQMAIINEEESQETNTKLSKLPVDLKNEHHKYLSELLHEYGVVFDVSTGLPPSRNHDHHIPLLSGSAPVNVRPYRALNAITVRDRYPIPTVEELFDELSGAIVFTKLDLRSGYHQILMASEDTHKTTFQTHDGHFEFLVMPFGLTNAPSTFQAAMNDMFRPILRKYVLVFMDDILVYSPSWGEHMKHLKVVFQHLSDHAFLAKASKCKMTLQRVQYLGHYISGKGIEVDPSKIEAMQRWPRPTNLKQLRGFLGLTRYYRRFVPQYAQVAAPLTKLLRKDAFVWDQDATESFEKLKGMLDVAPTLVLLDFALTFVVQTDDSGTGMGAVLSQQGRPITYYSR